MAGKHHNTQMFAFKGPPDETIELAGTAYRLVRVFKHDFWAMTCLYETDAAVEIPKVVVKCGRMQPFCGLPLKWYARRLRNHEEVIYKTLAGVRGVPRWAGCVGRCGYAIEYIEGQPLDHVERPPKGFFDRLRDLFDAVHARGVAYADSNKRSNILVGPDGQPYLIDYQISIRRRDDLPWPINAIIARFISYICGKDIYHLYKHKRRMCPDELTDEEEAISRRRAGLHLIHRKLTKPYRAVRRRFLRSQHEKGRLVSPSEELEDHYQPEKLSWRGDRKDKQE